MTTKPELLYHYTNQAGLIGILERQKLWATHIHYLNDTKEFWHTLESTEQYLVARLSMENDQHEQIKLQGLIDDLKSTLRARTYVTSFSARRDSLSQWRGYVGNQPGFALGFDFSGLERLAGSLGARLEPCIYDAEQQMAQVEALIAETLREDFLGTPFREMTIINNVPVVNFDGPNHFLDRLNRTAPLHKHSAFVDEREWRLIYTPDETAETIRFRPGQSMLIPYTEINLLDQNVLSCLKEIVVGPCPYPDLAKYSLQGLVVYTESLHDSPRIENSTAPYRYW